MIARPRRLYSLPVLRRALAGMKGEILWHEPLAPYTSLQVGGKADVLVFPDNVDDAIRVVRSARKNHVPFMVIGGTNVLVRDKGIRGIVMQLNHLAMMQESPGQMVYAQAGVRLPKLMQFAMNRKLSGMEWAAGIPGTVGGAVVMNAGTRLGQMQDVLQGIDFVTNYGIRKRLDASLLTFRYRKAFLPPGIVVGVWLQLRPAGKNAIQSTTKQYLQYRKATQPLTLPNAGSVFKNPQKDSAGHFIEQAGLKGLRIGDAEVSTKHGNFIVNRGKATADQVLLLIRTVRDRVARQFGIRLQLEWKVIGEK